IGSLRALLLSRSAYDSTLSPRWSAISRSLANATGGLQGLPYGESCSDFGLRRTSRVGILAPYSSRSAFMGSRQAAPKAGRKLAAPATTLKPASAMVKVAASHGFSP